MKAIDRARRKAFRSKSFRNFLTPLFDEAAPALVHAYEKTGRIITDENIAHVPREKLIEWDAAVAEYFALLHAAKSGGSSQAFH